MRIAAGAAIYGGLARRRCAAPPRQQTHLQHEQAQDAFKRIDEKGLRSGQPAGVRQIPNEEGTAPEKGPFAGQHLVQNLYEP